MDIRSKLATVLKHRLMLVRPHTNFVFRVAFRYLYILLIANNCICLYFLEYRDNVLTANAIFCLVLPYTSKNREFLDTLECGTPLLVTPHGYPSRVVSP